MRTNRDITYSLIKQDFDCPALLHYNILHCIDSIINYTDAPPGEQYVLPERTLAFLIMNSTVILI